MKSDSTLPFLAPWEVIEIELPVRRARPVWRWVSSPVGSVLTSRLPSAQRLLDEARNLGAVQPEKSVSETEFVRWLDDKARSMSRVSRIEQDINKLMGLSRCRHRRLYWRRNRSGSLPIRSPMGLCP